MRFDETNVYDTGSEVHRLHQDGLSPSGGVQYLIHPRRDVSSGPSAVIGIIAVVVLIIIVRTEGITVHVDLIVIGNQPRVG
jgi:hypothetical protein